MVTTPGITCSSTSAYETATPADFGRGVRSMFNLPLSSSKVGVFVLASAATFSRFALLSGACSSSCAGETAGRKKPSVTASANAVGANGVLEQRESGFRAGNFIAKLDLLDASGSARSVVTLRDTFPVRGKFSAPPCLCHRNNSVDVICRHQPLICLAVSSIDSW